MPIFGQVRHIEPSAFTKISALGVDEQRCQKCSLTLNLLHATSIRPNSADGFRVEARIVIWKANNVLQVPTFRSLSHGGIAGLSSVSERMTGVRSSPPFEIDHRNPDVAEVISGLTESDRVVLHPGGSITDGTRIEERR